jgi:hypothetical protein
LNWTGSQSYCKHLEFTENNTTDDCSPNRGRTNTGIWTNMFRVEILTHVNHGNAYFNEYIYYLFAIQIYSNISLTEFRENLITAKKKSNISIILKMN